MCVNDLAVVGDERPFNKLLFGCKNKQGEQTIKYNVKIT